MSKENFYSFASLASMAFLASLASMAFLASFALPLWPEPGGEGRAMDFKVKSYHAKAYKSVWDSTTGILTMDKNVDIALALESQTTAHIYCDWAEDNKSEGTGIARGHVRAVWRDLIIHSQKAEWDLVRPQVRFFASEQSGTTQSSPASGHLRHENFMNGRLDLDFDVLENIVDIQDNSLVTATNAKGFWIPR